MLIAALVAFTEREALGAPGAPVTGYYASVAFLAMVGALLVPPVFFQLRRITKVGAYIGIMFALGWWGTMLGQSQDAYERTPQGADQAQERRAERAKKVENDRIEAEADLLERETEQRSERIQAADEASERMAENLADCRSFFGDDISELSDMIEDRLHNPSSFEHVETRVVTTAPDGNVDVDFRAENRFGATRTYRVRADVNPDTCEVLSIGQFYEN